MSKHLMVLASCLFGLLAGSPNAKHVTLGELDTAPTTTATSNKDWFRDMVVLAIAPDGTWGVGMGQSYDRAVTQALAACKRKYRREIGCGYLQTSVRSGWSVMYRCGGENIIAAEKTLADAVQQARRREFDLRMHYVPDMPRCDRILTVDPQGNVIPNDNYSEDYLNASD